MNSSSRSLRAVALFLLATAGSSCGTADQQSSAQETHFWFTHCEGAEFRDVTADPSYGGGKPGVIVRINDNLILAPPESVFPHYLGADAKGPECKRIDDLPPVTNLSFRLRASTLRGPEPTTDEKFDPDIVGVFIVPKIQAPARDPIEIEKSIRASHEDSKAKGYPVEEKDYFGLRCFGFPRVSMTCFGSTTGAPEPDVVLSILEGQNVAIHADYYSPKYGGIGIIWLTGRESLLKWKSIASRIGVNLDEWNARRQNSPTSTAKAAVER
jgi:hypothetical protein